MEKNIHSSQLSETELLLKYLSDEATADEVRKVEAWVEVNRKESHRVAGLFYALRAFQRMELRNSLTAYHKVERRLKLKESRRRSLPLLYVAASLVGAVVLSSLFHLFISDKVFTPGHVVVQTNPGTRTTVMLPDGSQVELNSGSKLSYSPDFNASNRNVTLSGEGLFRVKKGLDGLFVVNSENRRSSIIVRGTTFNVQSFDRENKFSTTLLEGKIDVALKKRDGSLDTLSLEPNSKLRFYFDTDSVLIDLADVHAETAWTQGKLVFRKENMTEVLKRLAYYYNVEFEIKNPILYQYEFTGTFENRQLLQILEYLKISSHIEYTVQHPRTDDSLGAKRTKVILRQ